MDRRDVDTVNTLFHILGLDPEARVCAMFPYSSYPTLDASYLIIGYEWNLVMYAKEVEEALPKKQVPAGFESAIQQIDPGARHGVWCVTGVGEPGPPWSEVAETVSKRYFFSISSSQHIFAGLYPLPFYFLVVPIA